MESFVVVRRFARLTVLLSLSLFVAYSASPVANLPAAELAKSAPAALPALPEAVASFGAVVNHDWLYVYSGHIGEAHAHSKKNLSQKFQRLRLGAASEWESLPAGPGLQSVALVAYGDDVYRVGGLSAHNEPDED